MITANRDVRHFEVEMQTHYPPLPRAAALGIVYPSSRPPEARVELGLSVLEEWGYRPHLFQPRGAAVDFLAAVDGERAAAMQGAMDADGMPLLWAARGGYGVVRLLSLLDFATRAAPPVLLGFSDVSLLLVHAAQRHGWPAVHGPNVTTLARLDPGSQEALQHFLANGSFLPFDGLRQVRPGRASGPLVPINLTMLLSVVGTPYEVDLSGAILVLEDTGEPPYRLDRMLQQLRHLQGSSQLAGLVLGDLAGNSNHPLLQATIASLAESLNVPCCAAAPVGHGQTNWPLPVGLSATLDGAAGSLSVDPL